MLAENNVRTGFFEPQQFAIVLSKLRAGRRAAAKCAYLTGWRLKSEVLKLEWRQVDFDAGEVRLDAGQTKNGEGRVFPMTRELRALLKKREAIADDMKQKGRIMRYVFHRANGKPIRSFRKQWAKACIAAGCPGRCLTISDGRPFGSLFGGGYPNV
jgi:integrase